MHIEIYDKNNLQITFPYNKEILENVIYQLPNRTFNKGKKVWIIPVLDLQILDKIIKEYKINHILNVTLDEKVKISYLKRMEYYKKIKNLALLNDIENFSYLGIKSSAVPYNFQKVGATFLEEAQRALLAFEMGLGKSLTALMAFSKLYHEGKIKKPLIICPSSLKYNWAIEIAKFTDFSYTVIGGEKEERQSLYKNNSIFTIVNYDLLRLDIKFLQKIDWDLIIADEIQRAKNYNTAISKNIVKLKSDYIFALTGTPIENSIMDLFTITKFINPLFFGKNGLYFKARYCETDNWGKIQSFKNLDEINRKTSFFMIRRKKQEVLTELPEKTINFYYINLREEEKKAYNEFKNGIIEDLSSGTTRYVDVLSRIVFLREICDCLNLVVPQDKIISSKLKELQSILEDLPEESKVVIFTEYERMAKIIEDNIKYKCVHLHGGVKNDCKLEREVEKETRKHSKLEGQALDLQIHEEKQKAICKNCPYYNNDKECSSRKKIISKFNNEQDIKIFLSTNAGKEGLNLQVANVVINYDLSFNPAVNEQRIARIDRIGQKSEKILVINLVCHNTIEEKILRILEDKQDIFNTLIDKTDKDVLKRIGQDLIRDIL